MGFQSRELYNCDWCKNFKIKYTGKKHRECENADICQLKAVATTDLITLKCNNFKQPTFPYINHALLYRHIPQYSKDALSIKRLLETFFESIKSGKRIPSELYEEAHKISDKNGIDLCNLIEGDLDFFI
jgi:hypothetical protein